MSQNKGRIYLCSGTEDSHAHHKKLLEFGAGWRPRQRRKKERRVLRTLPTFEEKKIYVCQDIGKEAKFVQQ